MTYKCSTWFTLFYEKEKSHHKKVCTECARNVSLDKFSKQILTFDGGAKKTEYHRDFEYLEKLYMSWLLEFAIKWHLWYDDSVPQWPIYFLAKINITSNVIKRTCYVFLIYILRTLIRSSNQSLCLLRLVLGYYWFILTSLPCSEYRN